MKCLYHCKSVFLFLSLLVSSFSISQSTFKISGVLKDETKSVPFATILIKSLTDSSTVKYGFTDTLGQFAIPGVKKGTYFLEASAVGYQTYFGNSFVVNNSAVDLKTITILPDAALETIEVLQLRPIIEVKPDKTVLNIENTINATGTDAFELLRKAPGVIIDNNNTVILEGKSGVQIFIDNKPSVLAGDDLVNFLKSIQATDIDNIEIITQPSSKYDAAGNGGIINFVLRRDKSMGTNGTVGVGYGYGRNHAYNSSLSLNYRNKQVNIYGTYSNSFGKRWYFLNFERTQFGNTYQSETDNITDGKRHNAKIGADWFINKRNTIGVLVSGNFVDAVKTGLTETEIGPTNAPNPAQRLLANNVNNELNTQFSSNLNYRFADTSGHEFTADLDYGTYNRDANTFQPNLYLDGETGNTIQENNYRMFTPTNIQILTGKVDYAQNFFGGKLSAGAKYSFVNTDNVFEFFDVLDDIDVINNTRSNQFKYQENINAAYVNYSRKLNQKWGLQLGLRGEQTNSIGELISTQSSDEDLVERHYFNIFPSGGLTYNPSRIHAFALTVGRRIQRPNYQTLNPFENQIDELSFLKGNPFLQPQYTYNARVSHTYKYRFSTSVSYSYTQDFFAQITDTLGAQRSFLSSRNVADQSTISVGASLPFNLKKWWSVFVNVSAFNTVYIGKDDRFVGINRNTASFYAQSTFLLPKSLKFEVSGWFSSPSVWGGTYLTKSMGALNIAFEKKFIKDRLTLRVSGSDLLFTSPWRGESSYGELYISGSGGGESRRIDLTLSFNFGNNEVKASRKRKTGLQEEEKRTSGD